MSVNDWTTIITTYQHTLTTATFEIERMQAVYALGSCLTVMERELSVADSASVLLRCGLTRNEADHYRARFAGHAQPRVEMNALNVGARP